MTNQKTSQEQKQVITDNIRVANSNFQGWSEELQEDHRASHIRYINSLESLIK